MTTKQPDLILTLPDPLHSSTDISTPSLDVTLASNAVPVSQSLPVMIQSMAVPDSTVSDILPCGNAKTAQPVLHSALPASSVSEGESDSPVTLAVVHTTSTNPSLSSSANKQFGREE